MNRPKPVKRVVRELMIPEFYLSGKIRYAIDSKYRPGKPNQIVYGEWMSLGKPNHNVLTATGEAEYHDRLFVNASTGFNWIALTQSTITPLRADTALTGEETLSGFARAQATTRSYSGGTSTTTLTKTFTASGSITSILGSGLFNIVGPPVAGIMAHVANFTTGSGLLVSGDQLAVTWAATLGP